MGNQLRQDPFMKFMQSLRVRNQGHRLGRPSEIGDKIFLLKFVLYMVPRVRILTHNGHPGVEKKEF